MMPDKIEVEKIVAALEGVVHQYDKKLSAEIKLLKGASKEDIRARLTKIERLPGLPAEYFGLVALTKFAILGKKTDQFWMKIHQLNGMV